MRISEVNITPVKPRDGLVAFASIVIEDCLYLGSIAVHSRPDGSLRITYPAKKVGSKDLSVYHPITKSAGKNIEKSVLEKCEELFERSEDDRHDKDGREDGQTSIFEG